MRDLSIALVFGALASFPLAAQNTIVVQGGGAALQQAVDAAMPGDRLDVHAGSYLPVQIAKGITVDCRPGVVVRGSNVPVLIVTGVPATESLTLLGGAFEGGGLLSGPPVSIQGCAGQIVVDGIEVRTPNVVRNSLSVTSNSGPVLFRRIDLGTDDYFLSSALVSACDQVSFSHCPNLPPLAIAGSRVVVEECVIAGRNASIGLAMNSGDVSVAGGTIVGSFEFSALNPLPAIRMAGGRLSLAGAGSVVAGRLGPNAAPAIDLRGGEVRLAPTVALNSTHPTPILNSGGLVVPAALPAVSVDGVPPGSVLAVDVLAEAASLTAVFVDVPRTPTPLPFGDFWVGLDSPFLDLRTTPASGSYQFSGGLPNSLPLGLPVCLQPVSVTTAGQLWVGPAARTTLR